MFFFSPKRNHNNYYINIMRYFSMSLSSLHGVFSHLLQCFTCASRDIVRKGKMIVSKDIRTCVTVGIVKLSSSSLIYCWFVFYLFSPPQPVVLAYPVKISTVDRPSLMCILNISRCNYVFQNHTKIQLNVSMSEIDRRTHSTHPWLIILKN